MHQQSAPVTGINDQRKNAFAVIDAATQLQQCLQAYEAIEELVNQTDNFETRFLTNKRESFAMLLHLVNEGVKERCAELVNLATTAARIERRES